MMDPLSITASIVGILTAAGKIVEIVEPYVSRAKDAPDIAIRVFCEVNGIRTVLSSLRRLIDNLSSSKSIPRASLIQVDQLVIILTDGVLLFSELESILKSRTPSSTTKVRNRDRVWWAFRSNAIYEALSKLQRFQTSISTILNIFQCETDIAASKAQQALSDQLFQLLRSDEALSARMKRLEDSHDADSQATRKANNRPASSRLDQDSDTIANRRRPDSTVLSPIIEGATPSNPVAPAFFLTQLPVLSFERDLEQSRVYRRVNRRESLISFTSSALHSHLLSVFSGLSLAEVSVISVVALPLSAADIENSHHYNFGINVLEELRKAGFQMESLGKLLMSASVSLLLFDQHSRSNHSPVFRRKSADFLMFDSTSNDNEFMVVPKIATKDEDIGSAYYKAKSVVAYLFEDRIIFCRHASSTNESGGVQVKGKILTRDIEHVEILSGMAGEYGVRLFFWTKDEMQNCILRLQNKGLMREWFNAIAPCVSEEVVHQPSGSAS